MLTLDEKVKVEIRHCPDCLSEEIEVRYTWEKLVGREEWEDVRFLFPRIHCDKCGAVVEACEADHVIHDAACKAQGLLTPKEIRELRISIDPAMDQKKFAKLLGCDEITVARWESRERFQDEKWDRQIRQCEELSQEHMEG